MTIHIITIGDELLIGQVIDTNSAWLAQHFNELEIGDVRKIYTISDDRKSILDTVSQSFKEADLVIVTGGLGPTKDDITKKVLADFFDSEMEYDEDLYLKIESVFKNWSHKNVKINKEQFFFPKACELLENKMGTAPGMWFEKGGKVLISLPGVPFEMKHIMEHHGLPKLQEKFEQSPVVHRTIKTVGIGEGRLSDLLEDFELSLPADINLAYLPALGQVRLRLTIKGKDISLITKRIEEKKTELVNLIDEFVYGFEKETLSEAIGKMLIERNMMIGCAESCTGGYLSHLITSIPGSSAYFEGSVISYSNRIKQTRLDIGEVTLQKHGAVSEAVVEEMVKGVLKNLKTDLAISVSGIAGPDGGSEEKPVGTIWFAIGDKERIISIKIQLQKDRIKNIQYAGNYGLNLIRQFLLGKI